MWNMFVVETSFTVWGILASISWDVYEKKTSRKKNSYYDSTLIRRFEVDVDGSVAIADVTGPDLHLCDRASENDDFK